MRANHLTTAPRQRGGFSRETRPGLARVGTGTPAWVGVRSQRQLPSLQSPALQGEPLVAEKEKKSSTHLPGAPRRRRSLLGPLVAASPAAALGAALKGLKGRAAPPLAAPGPPRRPPGRGVRVAPAPVPAPRPRLQFPSPRGNVTGETWAVP